MIRRKEMTSSCHSDEGKTTINQELLIDLHFPAPLCLFSKAEILRLDIICTLALLASYLLCVLVLSLLP